MSEWNNIPQVKLGLVAVSRDCFVISLSERRRAAVAESCGKKGIEIYESKVTVENELDMKKALEDVKAAGCNALVVFMGNFGPETPETMLATLTAVCSTAPTTWACGKFLPTSRSIRWEPQSRLRI